MSLHLLAALADLHRLCSPGPKERHLESILHSTLRHVILTHNHPRTLIQITLQILNTPDDEYLLPSSFVRIASPVFSLAMHLPILILQRKQALSVLPALLQASILALLSASIPLSTTFTASSVAILATGDLALDPTPAQLATASSAHVLAFSSHGDLLLNESQGAFTIDEWDAVYELAQRACCKRLQEEMDEDRKHVDMQTFVERVLGAKVESERGWKNG